MSRNKLCLIEVHKINDLRDFISGKAVMNLVKDYCFIYIFKFMLQKNEKLMVNSERPSHQQIISLSELYQSERLDDAEQLAVSLTQEYHQHPFAWKALGAIFKAKGRRSEAVDANQTAIALSPQDFEAHYNLGKIHKELGKLDEAK